MVDTKSRTFVELSPTRCPFCHAGVETASEAWVACATCLARHHTECWDDGGACSACGRDQRLELAKTAALKKPDAAAPEDGSLVQVALDGAGGACTTIAQALAKVAAGGKILLAPGTYRESVVLDRAVTLAGNGGRGKVFIEATSGDAVRVDAERAGIEGITLRVRERSLGGETAAALRVKRGSVRVAECDVECEGTAPALVVEGLESRPRFQQCRIAGRGAGVLVAQGAKASFERCEVTAHRHFCFAARSGADPVVDDCRFKGGDVGLLIEDGARGTFKGCEVTLTRDAGVRVSSAARPTFVRLKVRDVTGVGIRLDDVSEGTFDDCHVFRGGTIGVLVERGADPLIKHAKVVGGLGIGVAFRSNARGRLEDCRISENAAAGVEISLQSHPQVAGCKVRGNEGAGIWAHHGGAGTVERCDLTSNRGGPWRDEGSKVVRRENVEA